MALKDFLRKIFKEEKHTPPEILEIPLTNLLPHLTREQERLDTESKEIKKKVDSHLSQFISALVTHQNSLKSVNIDSRKEDEKIKLIVKENLKHYASHFDNLIAELEKIDEPNLKELIHKIYAIIHNFETISRNNFEKATILTGELGKVRQEIRNFQNQMDALISENKKLFDRGNVIEELKRALQEIEKIKDATEEIDTQTKETETKQKEIEKDIADKKSETEKLRLSSEYKREQEQKTKHEREKAQFSQEITRIKEKIDLKFLAKHFHSDEKKSGLINSYLTNFLEALEHDEKLELEALIREAKSMEIDLKELKSRHRPLSQPLFLLTEEKINFLEKESKNLDSRLLLAKEEKDRYGKAISKLDEKRAELEQDIKEKAKSLDVAVV